MSRWTFPSRNLQSWPIYSRLPGASLARWNCFKLVPKVCFVINLDVYFILLYFRCDAHPKNLDGPGNRPRFHEMDDFLISTFDPGILWDEYGIRHDIVVSFISPNDSSGSSHDYSPRHCSNFLAFYAWIPKSRHT